MERTKVFIVLGEHGGHGSPANTRFFRRAVCSFLDEILQDGKKATMIYETALYNYPFGCMPGKSLNASRIQGYLDEAEPKNMKRWRLFKPRFSGLESRANENLNAIVGKGNPLSLFDGLGFEDMVLAMNRRNIWQVNVVIDPQNVDAMYATWALKQIEGLVSTARISMARLCSSETTELIKKCLSAEAEFLVLHDRQVFSLVERLRAQNPEMPVIIVRGSAHAGISRLFDPKEYDVRIEQDGRIIPGFGPDAASKRYIGENLTECELNGYAKLTQSFLLYLNDLSRGLRGFVKMVLVFVGAQDVLFRWAKNMQ